MKVFHKLADVPADFGPTLVSVGNFDGVHRGHRAVIAVARADNALSFEGAHDKARGGLAA